jgi:GntR family transcriptional regulator
MSRTGTGTGWKRDVIADELRVQILSGELQPGARLPTEATLSTSHDVNRETVRRALQVLEDEGLIYSIQGSGRYVRGRQPVMWLDLEFLTQPIGGERKTWRQVCAEQGFEGDEEIVSAGRGTPPPLVVERLGTSDATFRSRVLRLNGRRVQLLVTWYPAWLSRGTPIVRKKPMPPSVIHYIEVDLGYLFAEFITEWGARAATRAERVALDPLPPGVPILSLSRTGVSEDGDVLLVDDGALAADSHIIQVRSPAHLAHRP